MVAPQYEEFRAHHLSCRRSMRCVLQRLCSISSSYPSTFPLQFLDRCSAQCKGMAHNREELLRLVTGAIDRASPLLQDPVLLAARHLPPALGIYDQLGNSLMRLSKGISIEASGIYRLLPEDLCLSYTALFANPFITMICSCFQSLLSCKRIARSPWQEDLSACPHKDASSLSLLFFPPTAFYISRGRCCDARSPHDPQAW